LTVRTNAIHPLHPVVKLADGTLIVSDRAIDTHGEFLTTEIAFTNMRWYGLDPAKVIVLIEVKNPDLSRVDEVGIVMLAPGGGHGIAGSMNLSTVELFAHPQSNLLPGKRRRARGHSDCCGHGSQGRL
jgi:hypothetical protein